MADYIINHRTIIPLKHSLISTATPTYRFLPGPTQNNLLLAVKTSSVITVSEGKQRLLPFFNIAPVLRKMSQLCMTLAQ